MDRQQPGRASVRTSFRGWTAVAAMLLIAQFFAVPAPLYGQAVSRSPSDPFEILQRSLDAAVGEQLARVRAGLLVANTVARVIDDAGPASASSPDGLEGSSESGKISDAEQRFHLLGIDAGRIFREEGVPVALLRIAQVESNWKPFALSPKGAFGLW